VRHADLVRVYLPLTMADLASLHASGQVGPPPLSAHAVTPTLRREWGDADDEELEYAALMAAAFDSLVRIHETGAVARRVVVAADVPDADVELGDDETGVRVTVAVPRSACTSVHVDDGDAEADVALAIERLPEAYAGEGTALAAVSLVEHELLWFATQEIPDLLR
jgi:hypothetical protein